jgi:hypothetical protein
MPAFLTIRTALLLLQVKDKSWAKQSTDFGYDFW